MQLATRTLSATAIAVALTVPLLAAAGPAAALGHGVTNHGSCSRHWTFKLTAKHDDGAIEIEYEVDTNRAGADTVRAHAVSGRNVCGGHVRL